MKPASHAVAIARDALVIITGKNSTIPSELIHKMQNGESVIDLLSLEHAFSAGRLSGLQAYTFDSKSGTRRFFCTCLGKPGKPLQIGNKVIVVADDFDMVDKVARDPAGIGYCSAALADPNRVQFLDYRTQDGVVHYYPQCKQKYHIERVERPGWQDLHGSKYYWVQVEKVPWPLTRTLYAQYGGKAWDAAGTGIVNVMLKPDAPGTKALQAGPLYQASYYLP